MQKPAAAAQRRRIIPDGQRDTPKFLMIRQDISGIQEPVCKEQYPIPIVIASNLVSLLVYAIGILILSRFGIAFVVAYIFFILLFEFRLISSHCRDCFYFGKTCAFGKGRLSALFFSKGTPENFSCMPVTWKDLAPDFLLFMIPVLAGILLLVRGFSWMVLVFVIALLVLGFAGNALVRGQLACRYCRQREIGCPAEQLFGGKKESS